MQKKLIMSVNQADVLSMCNSYQIATPHSVCNTEDEYPKPFTAMKVHGGRVRRAGQSRYRTQPVTYDEIQEVVDEEGISPTEEAKANKLFLKSLESLRRSTQNLSFDSGTQSSGVNKYLLNSGSKLYSSLDSSDSDSTQE